MSGLFNEASLVLVPSGYKSGKVYSEVPTDGDGDLTFTRASSATRVNSDGLIESPRTNLVRYSEQFDNGTWTKVATTITSNTTNAPNGTLTADKLVSTSVSSSHSVYQNLGSVGDTRVISCFVKKAEYRYVTLQYGTAATRFDFDTLTFSGGTSNTYTDEGNGWYRISSLLTATINARVTILIPDNSGNISYVGDDVSGTFIWGAQAETGSTATEYIPTTTTARTTFAGITQDGTSASNVPRLDYSQGSCPALLLEPQRTNLFYPSDDFSGGSQNLITLTANTTDTLDPSGQNTADKFVVTTSGGDAFNRIGRSIAIQNFSFSVYLKATAGQKFQLFLARDSYAQVIDTNVLTTGEWQRVVVSGSFSTTSTNVVLGFEFGYTSDDSVANQIYYLWGAQLEAGSYATSYIPTTSATVTRLADACFKYSISSLIGQTEGVLFFEFDYKKAEINTSLFNTSLNNNDNIYLLALSDFKLRMYVTVGGVNQVTITTSTIPSEGRHKVALAYKENDCAFYLDGVQVGVNTSCTIPTVDDLLLKTPNQDTRQVLIFKTRLGDVDCEVLTGEIYTSYSEMATALGYTII
jgi:hypothetical protein